MSEELSKDERLLMSMLVVGFMSLVAYFVVGEIIDMYNLFDTQIGFLGTLIVLFIGTSLTVLGVVSYYVDW